MPNIGVSLAIPDPWGSELQDYRVGLGDESGRGIPTHITLTPPVEIGEGAVEHVVDHLRAVAARHRPFAVHLRGTGTFRPTSPVVFVMLAEGISACEQLAEDVRRGPLDLDLTFPYHPHVTVAHEMPEETLDRAFSELATYECRFTVERFHLYLHDDTVGWQPTFDFDLTGSRKAEDD